MTKKLLFLLGSANMSGGTYVILQHAQHLQKLGFEVTIALVFMETEEYLALKEMPDCWHPAIKELRFIHIDEVKEPFDIAIFTWWATLYSFEKINASSYVYFVQSIESRFYAKHETFMRHLVNNTYKIGLPAITEASWIQHILQNKYHNQCELVRNGILKSLYTLEGAHYAEKSTQQLRVLVEGPLNVAFKNVEKTIELCRKANVGEIWLLTSSEVDTIPEGVARVFSQIPITEVPMVYRSCDVIVKLSYVEGMFGPPLEMFHCGGTAIVYDVTGFDEYIKHDVNALVVKTDDEETVVNYLRQLHENRALLSRLIAGAKETAREWIDWPKASDHFAQMLEKLMLSDSSKQTIHKNIAHYLKERLEVVMVKDNQQIEKIYEASPLYDSGYYALSIPITSGKSQIGIAFGKLYKIFTIPHIRLEDISHVQHEVNCNVSFFQMTQLNDHDFECKSNSGMMVFNIDLLSVASHGDSNYALVVEFHPMVIWEDVPEMLQV